MELSAGGGLKRTQQEKRRAGRLMGRIKSVTEFLSDAVDGFKDTDFPDAIEKALPWAEAVGESVAEALPPVKFLLKLYEKMTKETDPELIGHLACTIAYERAVEYAIKKVAGPVEGKHAIKETKEQLALLEPSEDVDIGTFSFENALQHEFIRRADLHLQVAAIGVGYIESQVRQLTDEVHDRFVASLKALLSDGEAKEKFAPFTEYLRLGAKERQAYKALSEHAQYQRRLFEETPVFGREPFALKHIYIETECGKLTWGEINKPTRAADLRRASETETIDPFSERWGGRQSLIETVMKLLGDSDFRDAIIVQGVAGAGKSSFTLRLCSELLQHGLRPIRVRLKDLRLDRHVSEALPEAVLLNEEEQLSGSIARPEDLFLGGRIFNEETTFREARICRYVLILDGWDEISLSTAEGFKVRVARMLDQIRSQYLSPRSLPVRVILTGRPSSDVTNGAFLRDKTPILTIRTLRPDHLKKFVHDLGKAVKEQPRPVEGGDAWPSLDLENFASVFAGYEKEFAATMPDPNRPDHDVARGREAMSGSLAVLGLPLLAHLSVRLISQWKGSPEDLVKNPTTLYRSLVDLTCRKGGKPEVDANEVEGQYRILGSELRRLLQKTAAAITVCGEETISYRELSLRLNDEGEDLDRKATASTEEHVLSSLMISFYFKGGHTHLGCEFLHKSFREYLFAESVVEVLKEYGRRQQPRALTERTPYWKDFDKDDSNDQRYQFARDLAELLAPQWLSPEVVVHLERLILWEIGRTQGSSETVGVGTPTEPLDLEGWKRVRDGLADLWDWWAEGVHLRPQPAREGKRRDLVFRPPYVMELIEHSTPLDTEQRTALPEPARTTTMDAHLGDGLFRLCALAHSHIAKNQGWVNPYSGEISWQTPEQLGHHVSPLGKEPRRYQSIMRQGGVSWVLFAPSGENPYYFANYVCRINSAGWRPLASFPGFTHLNAVDLKGIILTGASLVGARLDGARLDWARLDGVRLDGASLDGASLVGASLDGASLVGARLVGARLVGTSLYKASLVGASLDGARLDGASLVGASLDEARLEGASLVGARLDWARLDGASLVGARLDGAVLQGTRGVTWEQIDMAVIDEETSLPPEFEEQKRAKLKRQQTETAQQE